MKIVVMAKAPLPGLAKTRLIPALGAEGAARLAALMLHHALKAATDAAIGPVELCATPDTPHPTLRAAAATANASLMPQGPGDLGQRLAAAALRAWLEHDAVLLMGTDAPALDAALLRQAAAALASHDAVLVPAADGGYALLGLRRLPPARAMPLFEGIAWSTSSVLAQTRTALTRAGLRSAELATVHDVDEPDDLVHLPPTWWHDAGITRQ